MGAQGAEAGGPTQGVAPRPLEEELTPAQKEARAEAIIAMDKLWPGVMDGPCRGMYAIKNPRKEEYKACKTVYWHAAELRLHRHLKGIAKARGVKLTWLKKEMSRLVEILTAAYELMCVDQLTDVIPPQASFKVES